MVNKRKTDKNSFKQSKLEITTVSYDKIPFKKEFRGFQKLTVFFLIKNLKSPWLWLLGFVVPVALVISFSIAPYYSPAQALGIGLAYIIMSSTVLAIPSSLIYNRQTNTYLRFKLTGYKPLFILMSEVLAYLIINLFVAVVITVITLVVVNNVGRFDSQGERTITVIDGFMIVQTKLLFWRALVMLIAFLPLYILASSFGLLLGSRFRDSRISGTFIIPLYFVIFLLGVFYNFFLQMPANPTASIAFVLNPVTSYLNIFAFIGGDSLVNFQSVILPDTEGVRQIGYLGGLNSNELAFHSVIQLINWLEIIVSSAIVFYLVRKFFIFYKYN